jgi:uncharacterized protein YoxC
MTEATTSGPITLADVRAALGDTDPSNTNASALRQVIGRGSYATIQKHLDAIRAELLPVVPLAPGQAPAAPAEAVAAVWAAAWSAAQAHTLGRLEIVTTQREQLAAQVAQLKQDLASALAQVDASTEAAAAISASTDQALAQAQAEREQLDADFSKVQAAAAAAALASDMAMERAKTDFERLKMESEARVAVMTRDAEIAAKTMQGTIDELNRQIHARDMLLAQVHAPAPAKTK